MPSPPKTIEKNVACHSWASVSSIGSNTFLRLSYFSFRDELAHRGSTTQTLGGSQEKANLRAAHHTPSKRLTTPARRCRNRPMLTTTLLHANN
jgi:hypothetical protein